MRLPAAAAVPPDLDEVDTSDLFAPAVRRHYQQDISYPTRGYLELLATYSGHRALTPRRRQGLFSGIAALIEGTYGGIITKRYLYELRVARRRPIRIY